MISADIYIKMIEWINCREFFWLTDLKEAVGFINEAESKDIASKVSHLIKTLLKRGYLQCSEKRGQFRQYYLVKKIEHKTFKKVFS